MIAPRTRFPLNRDNRALGAVQAPSPWTPFAAPGLTGAGRARRGFRPGLRLPVPRPILGQNTLCPRRRRAPLARRRRSRVRPRRSRWVAIRGMDIAAETIGIRLLRPKLLARLRDRPLVLDVNAKGVLRAAALTTLKLPLSH